MGKSSAWIKRQCSVSKGGGLFYFCYFPFNFLFFAPDPHIPLSSFSLFPILFLSFYFAISEREYSGTDRGSRLFPLYINVLLFLFGIILRSCALIPFFYSSILLFCSLISYIHIWHWKQKYRYWQQSGICYICYSCYSCYFCYFYYPCFHYLSQRMLGPGGSRRSLFANIVLTQ